MSKKGFVFKGFVRNYLTVISNEKVLKNGAYYYYCKCKCGNERLVSYNSLAYNRIQDCGCGEYALNVAKTEYIGKKFNNLTIIDCYRKKYQNNNRIFVLCKCDCGKEKEYNLTEVKNGHYKSCGCSKDFDFDRDYKDKVFHNIKILDLIDESKKIVKCQCHCGAFFEIRLIELLKKTRYLVSCKYCNDGINHKFNKKKLDELSNGEIKYILYRIKQRCYNPKTKDYKWYGEKGITVCDEWLNNTDSFVSWALQNGYQKGLTIDRIDSNGNYEPSNCRFTDMIIQNNNKSKLKKYNYNGEYLTISQISRLCGINYRTLLARINKGIPFEKAISLPVKKG